MEVQRVSAYIDGFNLYYGLRSKGWRRYHWLDLRRLMQRLLRPDQRLVAVRYFTTRVVTEPGDPDKPKRRSTYLDALGTLSDLTVHFGYFLPKERSRRHYGATLHVYEEKMTDVNIEVGLLSDAQDDMFDTAIAVSGDSNLSGPIEAVGQQYTAKRMAVAFPPDRASKKLRAGPSFTIGRDAFRDSQLPAQITSGTGNVLTKPAQWS